MGDRSEPPEATAELLIVRLRDLDGALVADTDRWLHPMTNGNPVPGYFFINWEMLQDTPGYLNIDGGLVFVRSALEAGGQLPFPERVRGPEGVPVTGTGNHGYILGELNPAVMALILVCPYHYGIKDPEPTPLGAKLYHSPHDDTIRLALYWDASLAERNKATGYFQLKLTWTLVNLDDEELPAAVSQFNSGGRQAKIRLPRLGLRTSWPTVLTKGVGPAQAPGDRRD